MMDSELLECPIETDDMRDLEELVENAVDVQKDFLARVLYQYQQETWISQTMRETLQILDAAHAKIAWPRSQNVFIVSES
jgi:hypothetical protein